MRLFEFEKLLETSYLNTDDYGAWINTNTNEIIPVGFNDNADYETHTDYLYDRYEINDVTDENALYYRAFKAGLVRTVHDSSLNIEGTAKALKKAWKLIRPTVMASKIVYVSIITGPRDRILGANDFRFIMPRDKIKLLDLVNSL